MSGANLVIAFDARIGNLEGALRRVQGQLRSVDAAASRTQRATASIGRAFSSIGSTAGSGLASAAAAVTRLTTAFAAIGAGVGITNALQSISTLADESAQLNISANALLALRDGFNEAGGSAEQATQGVGRLNDLIGDAARGTREAVNAFADLGIAFRNQDGSIRSTEAVLSSLIQRIQSASSEQEKLSIASQVFGQRAGRVFVQAINEMGGSLQNGVANLQAMGIALGTNVPQRIDEVGTAFTRLGQTISAAIAGAISAVSPQIVEFLNWLQQQVAAASGAIMRVIHGVTIMNRQRNDPEYAGARQANENADARLRAAEREVSRLENRIATAQRRMSSGSVLSRRAGEAELAPLQRQLDEANAALSTATREWNETLNAAAARGQQIARDVAREMNGPDAPPVTNPPSAAPPARIESGGGGARQTSEEVRELTRVINSLYEQTRTPLEAFQNNLSQMWRAVAQAGQNGIPQLQGGMETVRRGILEYAEDAARALARLGERGRADMDALREHLEGLGPRLLESGAVASVEEWSSQVQAALNRAAPQGGFWGALQQALGMGAGANGETQSFDEAMGQGLGQVIQSSFGELFNLFEKVADGSMKAGEAIKKFAVSFVTSILRMVAQAAAMRMIQSFMSGISGGWGFGGGGGIPGKMAGGAVAGGYTYLVGERGPELFTAPGAGRIIPNHELGGGGFNVVVNNNAPGVVVKQRQIDEQTLMLAVAMSREQVAADFSESTRTGHGSYAEPLSRSYNIRRRF